MKKIIILILLLVSSRLWSDEPLQEHVEVVGRFFAAEPNSKNIIIVDRREIEQSHAPSVAALLNQLPALNVSRRGADDSSFDLSMRGSHFEQIQVLVNGIPFNNPQTGHFNTDFPFSLQDIERIEIIRGGNSTAFGAGAFAGVINFVLKTESRFRLGITSGEKNYRSLYVAAGHELGRFSLSASLRRQSADGFYAGREFAQTQASLRLHYKKNDFYSELQSGWLDKSFGADGFYAPYPSWRYPSFTELYYQAPGNFGDPALLPERSRNGEISLTMFSATRAISWSGDLTFFYRRQLQTIDWVRMAPEFPWQAVNIDSNDIAGCETVQRWQIAATTIGAGIERLWVITDRTRFQSKYSLRFPDRRYFFSLQQPLLRWLTCRVEYQYKHIYKTSVSGHFCDMILTTALGKWRISLRAENLFDTRIEEIPGVKISGRWLYLSLTL